MKTSNLPIVIVVVTIVFSFSFNSYAQTKDNPWMIGFGVNAVDFYPTNINGMTSEKGIGTVWYDQFFNLNDHYNYIAAPSKLSLARYINRSFSADLALTINKITKFGDIELDKSVPYFAADLNVNYDINALIGETGFFDPYVFVGGGYNSKSGDGDNNIVFKNYGSFNSGAGAKFWFTKKFGLRVQTMLRYFFNDGSYRHFQHSASLLYQFGGYDEDNDGIIDKNDKCPSVFGLKEFNGCPDSDNDGVEDEKDKCPNVFGIQELGGCPDADGDGVIDSEDRCPTAKGTKENMGCPDTDGDGLIDARDACPNEAGPISNKGCPEPDSDGDGVVDRLDKCKFEPGALSNNGCPIITEKLTDELTELSKSILFVSGYDVYYPEYQETLNKISEIMKRHPELTFVIEGYTDNVGDPDSNYRLSIKRVNKVLNYLVSVGVSQNNLRVRGFGENMPIAPNNTSEGRAKNRRVEIKVLK